MSAMVPNARQRPSQSGHRFWPRPSLWVWLLCVLALPQYAWGSVTSAQYLQQHGPPDLFLLIFAGDEIDELQARRRPLTLARRIESWAYLRRGLVAVFDGEYFVREKPLQSGPWTIPFTPTDLQPAEFGAAITPQQIEMRHGRADLVESAKYGARRYEAYRYIRPERGVKSFAFLDGRLVAVSAGFAMTPVADLRLVGAAAPTTSPLTPTDSAPQRLAALGGRWGVGRVGGTTACSLVRTDTTEAHGNVFDGCHPNESFFRLDGNQLLLRHADGTVTSRIVRRREYYWEGLYIAHPSMPRTPGPLVHFLLRRSNAS